MKMAKGLKEKNPLPKEQPKDYKTYTSSPMKLRQIPTKIMAPFFKNQRPLYVNSIAVDTLGNIYTLARINREGRTVTDLIKINLIA